METVLWAFLAVCLCSATADGWQNRQEFACPTDGFFAHPTDCTSYFRCYEGVATLKTCSAPLHYNKYSEGCDWPLSDTCSPDEYDSVPEYASPPLDAVIPPGVYCPPRCICELPHPCNCSLYFRCYFQRPILKMCPGGLHFNTLTDLCDLPDEAHCDRRCPEPTERTTTTTPPTPPIRPSIPPTPPTEPSTPPTEPPTPPTEPPTPPPPSECCCNFKEDRSDCRAYFVRDKRGVLIRKLCPVGLHFNRADKVCDLPGSAQCSKPVGKCDCECCMVQDECDCYKYFYCEDGILTHEKCADGLMFNPKIQTCDYIENVNRNCTLDPFTTTEPSIPTFTTPVTPTTPGSICSCGNCILPNPSDCSSYYRCLYGNLQSVRCPPGQLFNRKTKQCAPKGYESCPSVGDPELCPREQGLFPLPGKCTDFVECDRGVAYIQKCPDNTEFNPQTQLCDWPSKACGGKIPTDNLCPRATGLFPHPDNCAKFFHCEQGTRLVKDCPSPLHFNARLGVCDWPENAHCGEVQMYSKDNVETECKETPGIDCPCACRIPNYDSCSGYYQCTSEGKACSKTCPSGLQFNRVKRVCDIPENAKCSL